MWFMLFEVEIRELFSTKMGSFQNIYFFSTEKKTKTKTVFLQTNLPLIISLSILITFYLNFSFNVISFPCFVLSSKIKAKTVSLCVFSFLSLLSSFKTKSNLKNSEKFFLRVFFFCKLILFYAFWSKIKNCFVAVTALNQTCFYLNSKLNVTFIHTWFVFFLRRFF